MVSRVVSMGRMEPTVIDDVKAFILAPKMIAPENRNRLLVNIHGGRFVYNPGVAGTQEPTSMAAYGGFKIISIDYRMPPDHPCPAGLDDCLQVWRVRGLFGPGGNLRRSLAAVNHHLADPIMTRDTLLTFILFPFGFSGLRRVQHRCAGFDNGKSSSNYLTWRRNIFCVYLPAGLRLAYFRSRDEHECRSRG